MTRSLLQRVTLSGALVVSGLAVATLAPASAATCASGVEGDVNGDGYAEVAVSEAGRSYGEGAVHVFYGRAKGLTAAKSGAALDDQYLDQDQPGVAGTGADYDRFGAAVAFGDYNDDGCADLAVGAPEDSTAGTLYVFYGSKTGLKTSGSVRMTQAQVVGGDVTNASGFGGLLVAADLDDDGVTDLGLSVGAKRSGTDGNGTVVILRGGTGGLSPTNKTELDREANGIDPDAVDVGRSLAVGDFDGNGVRDLAVGLSEGQLQIFEAGADGLESIQGPLTGPDVGVDDLISLGDDGDRRVFGDIIAAGDVDADGSDDLAVGMPAKGLGGTVALVKGSPSGLVESATPAQTWTQASTGVVGTDADDDAFGAAIAMGRLNPGGFDDLAIGVPGDDIGTKRSAGSVNILLGSAGGLTTSGEGGARYHQDTSGVPGTAEIDDALGRTLTIANVQSETQGSLIIGALREKIGSITAAGQFHQLSVKTAGPTGSGSVAFNLDSTGVRGASRNEAELGLALD